MYISSFYYRSLYSHFSISLYTVALKLEKGATLGNVTHFASNQRPSFFVKSISRKFREIDTWYFIFTLLSLLLWSSVDWAKTSVQVWQSLNLCHLFCRTTANNKTQHQNQLCNFESWCFGFRKCSEIKTTARPMPTINWCRPSTNSAICIQIE